jgi:hypothetical protein
MLVLDATNLCRDIVQEAQPLRYKGCLARDHQVKDGAVPVGGVNRFWVMPRDDVISEAPDRIQIPARRERAANPAFIPRNHLVARRLHSWRHEHRQHVDSGRDYCSGKSVSARRARFH